ncbi:MAG: hypothetical protein ACRD96_14935, partial [Bryobacteraceae bacterium]
ARTLFELLWRPLWLTLRVAVHAARHPEFIDERVFKQVHRETASATPRGKFWRPLFGWGLWMLALVYSAAVLVPAAVLLGDFAALGLGLFPEIAWLRIAGEWAFDLADSVRPGSPRIGSELSAWIAALNRRYTFAIGTAAFFAPLWLLLLRKILGPLFGAMAEFVVAILEPRPTARRFATGIFGSLVHFLQTVAEQGLALALAGRAAINLGMQRALLNDFHLRLRLLRLFQEPVDGPQQFQDPPLRHVPVPALLVAAPLEILPSRDRETTEEKHPAQLWASNKVDGQRITVVETLRACLAFPRIFAPVIAEGNAVLHWWRGKAPHPTLHLVNGAVVRRNPLPALFSWLDRKPAMAYALKPGRGMVHLVYDTPIERLPALPVETPSRDGSEPALPNLVEGARVGLRLSRRRDNRLEVMRTRQLSNLQLEYERRVRAPKLDRAEVYAIEVEEIAPASELKFENTLRPTETEVLQHVASGCRHTLSTIYRDRLGVAPTPCPELLVQVAGNRQWSTHPHRDSLPGISEVCRHCTRVLTAAAPRSEPPLLPRSWR